MRKSPPRSVRLGSLDDVAAEVSAIADAHACGPLEQLGGWTPAQNLEHLGRTVTYSLDGFGGFQAPFLIRFVAKNFMKHRVLRKGIPAGIKLPKKAEPLFVPPAGLSFEAGFATLQGALQRVSAGERMTATSPVFGALDHAQWTRFHLHHASLHLGHIGGYPSPNR